MIQLEALKFQMPREYKISPNFNTLPRTINLLASELGNVIKDQAGIKYFRIVETIRQDSKNVLII